MSGVPEATLSELTTDVVDMTGGSPYFIESYIGLLHANGALYYEQGKWGLYLEDAFDTEIHYTIEEAITARIASLTVEEQSVLEKAAVLGNVFWISAVVAMERSEYKRSVANKRDAVQQKGWTRHTDAFRRHVEDIVDGLQKKDFLLILEPGDSSIPGDVEVIFKHNLEHGLLRRVTSKSAAKRYSRVAAQWMQSRMAPDNEEQWEALAVLFHQAGNDQQAMLSYAKAGDVARVVHKNEFAQNMYRQVLSLTESEYSCVTTQAMLGLLWICVAKGDAMALKLLADQCLETSWDNDDARSAGMVHTAIAVSLGRRAKFVQAQRHFAEAKNLLSGSLRELAHTDRQLAQSLEAQGDYPGALEVWRQVLVACRNLSDHRGVAGAQSGIGRGHLETGNFKAAKATLEETLQFRRQVANPEDLIQTLGHCIRLSIVFQNIEACVEWVEEAEMTAKRIQDTYLHVQTLLWSSEIASLKGNVPIAEAKVALAKKEAADNDYRILYATSKRIASHIASMMDKHQDAYQLAIAAIEDSDTLDAMGEWAKAHLRAGDALVLHGVKRCKACCDYEPLRKGRRSFFCVEQRL